MQMISESDIFQWLTDVWPLSQWTSADKEVLLTVNEAIALEHLLSNLPVHFNLEHHASYWHVVERLAWLTNCSTKVQM